VDLAVFFVLAMATVTMASEAKEPKSDCVKCKQAGYSQQELYDPLESFHRDLDYLWYPFEHLDFLSRSMSNLARFVDGMTETGRYPEDIHPSNKKSSNNKQVSSGASLKQMRPRIEWQEDRDGLKVTAFTPGLPRDDLAVEVVELSGIPYLEIRGHTTTKPSAEKDESAGDKHVVYYDFEQRIRLPQNVKQESMKAKYQDGLLVVNMQQVPKAKPERRKIMVE
jgi:HSP20 family molecular chaperone IbpA